MPVTQALLRQSPLPTVLWPLPLEPRSSAAHCPHSPSLPPAPLPHEHLSQIGLQSLVPELLPACPRPHSAAATPCAAPDQDPEDKKLMVYG